MGCLSEKASPGCAPARALRRASWVTVTPDGHNVYVGAETSGAVGIFDRAGDIGGLVQPSGSAGCLAERAVERCASGRGLGGARPVAVSPDGSNVYVGTLDGIAIFRRDPGSGALSQLPGRTGCVREPAAEGCGAGRGLTRGSVRGLAVSADGHTVYAAVRLTSVVAIFARNPVSGALGQLPGRSGCISESRRRGCTRARGLRGPRGVMLSPDQRFAYVSGEDGDAVAVFARDRRTGGLRQLRGRRGCLQQRGRGRDGCESARAFLSPHDFALSPDGHYAYVAAANSAAVAVLRRDQRTGTLRQLGGSAGCVKDGGGQGCAAGRALGAAHSIAVAPTGAVYVAGTGSNAIAVFDADPRTAALRQRGGSRGCIASRGPPRCARAVGLRGVHSVALSPDARTLYAASELGNAVVAFVVASR